VNEDFSPKPAYLFLQSILRPAAVARAEPSPPAARR